MVRPILSIVLALHESPLLSRRRREEILGHFLLGVRDLLYENDGVAVSIYVAGQFLKIASQRKTVLLSQLRSLTEEGRLEWLGGGMNDPLLPLLPRKMQKLQIRTHRKALEQLVGVRPRGFWLPSFVWEQSLVNLLVAEGFEYTILKDYQIEKATWRSPTGDSYWTIEDRGRVLRILSASSELPELLIAGSLEEIVTQLQPSDTPPRGEVLSLSFLRDRRGFYEEERLLTLQQLVRRFVEVGDRAPLLKQLSAQVDELPPSTGMNLHSSVGRSLGLDERLQSCRDLLLQQPECNYLHKRMIWLWRNIERLPEGRVKQNLEETLLPVGSIYWYRNETVSGGISHLEDRAACHQILSEVELALRKASDMEGARFDSIDFLGNGDRQLLYRSSGFCFLVEPRYGGRLRSLDYYPRRLALINGFHPALPDGIEGTHFSVDPVCGLRDWFAPPHLSTVAEWLDFLKDDSGLLQAPHDCNFRIRKEGAQVALSGEQLCRSEGRSHPLRIEKVLTLKEDGDELFITLQLTNLAFHSLQGRYAVEFNFSFSEWDLEQQQAEVSQQHTVSLTDAQLLRSVDRFDYSDRESATRVSMRFVKPCALLTIPISTHGAEGELLPQCLKVIAFWDLNLMGQEKLNSAFSLRVERLRIWN